MPTIILDEGAFQTASMKLEQASEEMAQLVIDMENSVAKLEKGFDTPAGRCFQKLYRERVITQTREQGEILQQISTDLEKAKHSYRSVFEEYRRLIALTGATG